MCSYSFDTLLHLFIRLILKYYVHCTLIDVNLQTVLLAVEGDYGRLYGNIFKFRLLHNWALIWCKWKHTVRLCSAWLSREQPGSRSPGICCVWGLPFCLPARGRIHGLFSSCAAAVTGTASLTRQRDALSTQRREGALVSVACPVATVKQWGCKGAWEWPPCWAWSPVFVPYIRLQPSTSR